MGANVSKPLDRYEVKPFHSKKNIASINAMLFLRGRGIKEFGFVVLASTVATRSGLCLKSFFTFINHD